MTARISPRYIVIETSLKLTTPPKRRVTCWMSKTRSVCCCCAVIVIGLQPLRRGDGADLGRRGRVQPVQLGRATPRRNQAGRPEDHHRENEGADPHLPVLQRDLRLEELGQPGEHRGTG